MKKDKAVQDHEKKIERKKIKETLLIGTESRNSSTEGRHENILSNCLKIQVKCNEEQYLEKINLTLF